MEENKKTHSYFCPKCKSKYTDMKKPLSSAYCVTTVNRNPNPVYCNGLLIKTK